MNTGPEGIRKFPYSTNMDTNPTQFDMLNIPEYSTAHVAGMFWANTLYSLMWGLIEKRGNLEEIQPQWDYGLYTQVPRGGRNYAVKLVMDAMKLMPCGATFLDARDAIIDTEYSWTAGSSLCPIWNAFAYVIP